MILTGKQLEMRGRDQERITQRAGRRERCDGIILKAYKERHHPRKESEKYRECRWQIADNVQREKEHPISIRVELTKRPVYVQMHNFLIT